MVNLQSLFSRWLMSFKDHTVLLSWSMKEKTMLYLTRHVSVITMFNGQSTWKSPWNLVKFTRSSSKGKLKQWGKIVVSQLCKEKWLLPKKKTYPVYESKAIEHIHTWKVNQSYFMKKSNILNLELHKHLLLKSFEFHILRLSHSKSMCPWYGMKFICWDGSKIRLTISGHDGGIIFEGEADVGGILGVSVDGGLSRLIQDIS